MSGHRSSSMLPSKIVARVMSMIFFLFFFFFLFYVYMQPVGLWQTMIIWPVRSETPFCSWEYGADGSKTIPSLANHFLTRLLCSSDL